MYIYVYIYIQTPDMRMHAHVYLTTRKKPCKPIQDGKYTTLFLPTPKTTHIQDHTEYGIYAH